MALAPSPPPARGPGVVEARRKVLLDDLVAGRSESDSLAAPVLSIDPVSLDAIPKSRGRRRIEDVEEAAARNQRSAEEAREALRVEHGRLEAEASISRKMEREVGSLRREIERMQEGEKLSVAQARFSAEREARDEVLADVEQVREEHARAAQEIERLRQALDSDRTLMSEFSDRLREEQYEKAQALADGDRANEARRQAEQRLELAAESARRQADEGLTRLEKTESALRDALAERDALAAQVSTLASEDGRERDLSGKVQDLEHLVVQLEGALSSERARTDAAVAHAGDLTDEMGALQLQRDEELSSIAVVEQLEAELDGALVAHRVAANRVDALEEERTRLAEQLVAQSVEHAELVGMVDLLERSLESNTGERDALLAAVDELRTASAGELAAARDEAGVANSVAVDGAHALEAERTRLAEQLGRLNVEHAELVGMVDLLERSLETTTAERDSLLAAVDELRTGSAGELAAVRETTMSEARELEHLLTLAGVERDSLVQEASDLHQQLATLVNSAGTSADAMLAEHRQVEQLEHRLNDALTTRDTNAKQVQDLEASLAESSEQREDAVGQAEEIARALSQEQLRVQEAEVELRRLRQAASPDMPATTTGRAELPPAKAKPAPKSPAATPAPAKAAKPARQPEPEAKAEPEAKSEPEPVPEPPPAKKAAPAPRPPVNVRSAMAELSSIASSDTKGARRRR